MCVALRTIKARYQGLEGERVVPCRKCKQCRNRRLSDFIGRSLAEAEMSDQVLAVTLTYDGNIASPHQISSFVYKDIQNYLKRLRNDGFKFRYFVAGETGKQNGRIHWHLILFFKGKRCDVDIDKRINHRWWAWGFSFFQKANAVTMRYALKYITKDFGKEKIIAGQAHGRSMFRMSLIPALGVEYLERLAETAAKQGLAPHPTYTVSHYNRHGNLVHPKFYIMGAAKRSYVTHWLKAWAEHQPGRRHPQSEFLEDWFDRETRRLTGLDTLSIEEVLERKKRERRLLWAAAGKAHAKNDDGADDE